MIYGLYLEQAILFQQLIEKLYVYYLGLELSTQLRDVYAAIHAVSVVGDAVLFLHQRHHAFGEDGGDSSGFVTHGASGNAFYECLEVFNRYHRETDWIQGFEPKLFELRAFQRINLQEALEAQELVPFNAAVFIRCIDSKCGNEPQVDISKLIS